MHPRERIVRSLDATPRYTRTAIADVMHLDDLVRRAARLWPEKPAWVFDSPSETLTFGEVEARTRQIAAALAARGVSAGDRVGLMVPNISAFPLVWLALCRLGAATVPLNIRYQRSDLAHIVQETAPVIVIVADAHLDVAQLAIASCSSNTDVLTTDELFAEIVGDDAGIMRTELSAHITAATVANIQFTSGTTGKPKGCVLSHQYWLTIASTLVSEDPQITADDVIMTAQPFSYIDPQWNVMVGLLSGATVVILDGFHPSTFWERARAYGVSYFYCLGVMPALLEKMPHDPDELNHSVRFIQASAIPQALHSTLTKRWGVPWGEAFGMTETGADLYVPASETDAHIGTSSIGIARAHREVAVVDDADNVVGPGEVGRMMLRGDGMFSGYFGISERSDPNDWFDTGDLVTYDEAGQIYYVGRTKDMIRRSGENIAASEVEAVIESHDDVQLAAVAAVPDDLRGEEAIAFVVLDPRVTSPSTEAFQHIRAHCEAELAAFKVPRYWISVDSLPRTPSERIAKPELLRALDIRVAWDSAPERRK